VGHVVDNVVDGDPVSQPSEVFRIPGIVGVLPGIAQILRLKPIASIPSKDLFPESITQRCTAIKSSAGVVAPL